MTLTTDEFGCLEKAKHSNARASLAYGYIGSFDTVEIQALVRLPKYGDRPGIKAPYLPKKKLEQLLSIIGGIEDIDISDLTFEINCAIPGGRPYAPTLDLPLTVSMLSSYFQRQIPLGSLFIGEVDLFQAIRPLSDEFIVNLAEALADSSVPGGLIEQIYVATSSKDALRQAINERGLRIAVHGAANLPDLLGMLWPDSKER